LKKLLLILLLLPIFGFGQNSFYLGGGMISSFANSTNNKTNKDSKSSNLLDFGLYYGNNLKINNYLETVIEVFYLNNRVVLAQNGNKRFELHQNIGFGLKPGFYYKKHSIHLSTGIIAVYLFDKDEVFGNQIDYFDESFFYGIDYNYDFTKSVSCNLGVIFSKFEKISQWTIHTLKDFSIVQRFITI
jgi:hypothetical protein